jgi:hypothetical protein
MVGRRRTEVGASPKKMTREKLSTTVSAETHEFLQQMVDRGEVATLAEALDAVVARIRELENRRRLALATTQYFEQLGSKAASEEESLAQDLSTAAGTVDYDQEI